MLHYFLLLIPVNWKNEARIKMAKLTRNNVIKKWQESGRPVPPPHIVKQDVIETYAKKFGCRVLVETGTFLGDTIEMQRQNFDLLYSIELGEKLWKNAVKRFEEYRHIRILKGDSGKVLYEVMPGINERALFWLDGHYSAGITAKGEKNCPIYEELDAIFQHPHYEHVLLIDDARAFIGKDDYPTIKELTDYILSKDPRYSITVADDIIRAVIE